MNITDEVLKKAINGESNAINHYKRFQEIAIKENLSNIAYLFKALVIGEGIHAENHKRALGTKIDIILNEFKEGTTLENLQFAIDAEHWEYTSMYPGFLKQIKKETKETHGKVAELSMTWAKNVEIIHEEILKMALESLKVGKDLDIPTLYVCRACGNLYMGEKPTEVCSVCKHDALFYLEVTR
jgi:rubrerythrin